MPNRIIKESIRESYSVNALSDNAEILFYRLITYADDYGLFKADPLLINSILFPLKKYKKDSIIKWINEIAKQDIIFFYIGSDGKPYGKFSSWESHQNIRNHKPKYPFPKDCEKIYIIQELMSNCKQLNSIDINCARNPIQSNPIINPNPTVENEIDEEKVFDEFWEIYPRNIGKAECRKKWKTNKLYQIHSKIIDALKYQIEKGVLNTKDLKYCPHPLTWINQERWEDISVMETTETKQPISLEPEYDRDRYLTDLRKTNGKLQAWFDEQVLKRIEESITTQSFETWFKPIQVVRVDNRKLLMYVPSEYFVDWLNEHYRPLIDDVLKQACNGNDRAPTEIEFTAAVPEEYLINA